MIPLYRSRRKWLGSGPPTAWTVILFLVVTSLAASETLCGQNQPPFTQASPRDYSKLKPPSVPFHQGPVIPGLRQGAVPQGITYVRGQDRILISHYLEGAPSRVSVVDNSNGKITSSIVLKEGQAKFHYGHVGGIAAMGGSLWVASEGKILQYDLQQFLSKSPPPTAVPLAVRPAETRASFCTATDDTLFVGEFAYGSRYPTDPSHHLEDRKGIKKYAWVCGYSADDPLGKPKFVLSVTQRVQGMYVTKNRVFLSLSYGRRNRSTIVIYRNPLGEPPHAKAALSDGATVPLWFLDGEDYLTEIDFPPMAEGITMIGGRLAVLSESGAARYQPGGKGPLDFIMLLDVPEGGKLRRDRTGVHK
jgi:hypothetical protein